MNIIDEINKLEYIRIEDDECSFYSIYANDKLLYIINTIIKEYMKISYDSQIDKQLCLYNYKPTLENFLGIVVKLNNENGPFKDRTISKRQYFKEEIKEKILEKKYKRQIFILNGDE